jgi:photosystem II stability/assembly factor-like uncharacterized protein
VLGFVGAVYALFVPRVAIGASLPASELPMSSPLQPWTIVRAGTSDTMYLEAFSICDHTYCPTLLRTEDGGRHFTKVTMPPVSAASGSPVGSLRELVFANAEDGYAIEGQSSDTLAYTTFDGGRNWHKESVLAGPGRTILDFAATSSYFYAVTAASPTSKIGTLHAFEFARSPVASLSWSSTPLARADPYGVGMAAFGSTIWLSEEAVIGGEPHLAISSDGGRTWNSTDAPRLVSTNGCGLSATSLTTLWAECPTGMMEGLLYSADGGRSWRGVPAGERSGTAGGAFDPVSSSLAYVDRGSTAGTGILDRLTDGSRSVEAVGRLAASNVLALEFTDEQHGMAVVVPQPARDGLAGPDELLRTTDGGKSWRSSPL